MACNTPLATRTVASLRQELAQRGLPVSGLKTVLVQRLEAALASESNSAHGELTLGEKSDEEMIDEDLNCGEVDDGCDASEDERGSKRKRIHDTDLLDSSDAVQSTLATLSLQLKAAHKETERLQFQLEEAHERVAVAKQEGKREGILECQKELTESRGTLDMAQRKREELEFKLSQKEDELRLAAQSSIKPNDQLHRALKDETKKRESIAFECEQLKDQLTDYKQQVKILQQKIETHHIHTEREKKETSRSLLEERGKAESIRLRMESQRDELVRDWRREFDKQIEDQQEELRRQIRDAKKLQKELTEKTILLERKMEDRMKAELQRLAEMQADLNDKENQIRENDKLQEELDAALEQRQRLIDEEAAHLESDKQDFEERRQAFDKERQEFEERLWVVDRDVKRRRDKEKELNDQVMELLARNEAIAAESAAAKDIHLKQKNELTIENENLKNSLALAHSRVVSARGNSASIAQPQKQAEDEVVESLHESATNTNRQTRSQSRTQEQQSRVLLLSKTRSRPSYIPKPASRKIELIPPVNKANNNNKENTQNNSLDPERDVATAAAALPARKQRASMIPIRKGSSLVSAPSTNALRG